MDNLNLYVGLESISGGSSPSFTTNHFVRWSLFLWKSLKLIRWSLNKSSSSGGFILWDWKDKLIKAGTTYYGQTFILVAETRALRDGIRSAIQGGYNKIETDGDNLIVIEALRDKFKVAWQIPNSMEDVRIWLAQYI